jgi:hypothetical protein
MMQQYREAKRVKVERAKREGKGLDAVTGASSLWHKTKREKNPQLRLSYENTPAATLSDTQRTPSKGRLLLVFDSPDHSLRHVSYQRTMSDSAAVARDLLARAASLGRSFAPGGAPSRDWPKLQRLVAAVDAGGPPPPLPLLTPFTMEWRFPAGKVRSSAIRYEGRGTVVSETIEVPWPIRAAAAARHP